MLFEQRKAAGRKSVNFVSGQYLSYKETFKVFISYKDCLSPESRDFNLRSFEQVQGQWNESTKFVSSQYLFYEETGEVHISHKDCLWSEGVSWF